MQNTFKIYAHNSFPTAGPFSNVAIPPGTIIERAALTEANHGDLLLLLLSNDACSSVVLIAKHMRVPTMSQVVFSEWALRFNNVINPETLVSGNGNFFDHPLPLRGTGIRGQRIADIGLSAISGLPVHEQVSALLNAPPAGSLAGRDGFLDFAGLLTEEKVALVPHRSIVSGGSTYYTLEMVPG